MNAKFASLVIVSVLSWATVGGCPAPVDVTDGVTTPENNGSEDSGSSTPSSNGTNSDSGTTDGSAGPGTADSASDTSGDGMGGDADGGSAPGDDGSGADDDADAGDSTDGDDSDDEDTSPVFQGTYSGQIQRVKRESLGGPLGSEQQWTTTFSITFDSHGMPTAFLVPGYGQTEGGIDFMPEVNRVGQTVTLTESSGSYSATLTVTVAVATYEETSARVVLSLE
ncbi:MAG: hypothetical protein ACE5I3_02225, partial [Phycisphaerae bacterium]